jgi:hypothetical protein
MSGNLPCSSSSLNNTPPISTQHSNLGNNQNMMGGNMQQHNQMVAAFDEIADGQLKLRLDQVLGMQLEQKHVKSAMIGRFVW